MRRPSAAAADIQARESCVNRATPRAAAPRCKQRRSRPDGRPSSEAHRKSSLAPARSFKQFQPVADLKQPRSADANGCKQHEALKQRLPKRVEIEDEEEISDRAEHQRAEDGADRASRAAVERD